VNRPTNLDRLDVVRRWVLGEHYGEPTLSLVDFSVERDVVPTYAGTVRGVSKADLYDLADLLVKLGYGP
jgi:hypothetical protein